MKTEAFVPRISMVDVGVEVVLIVVVGKILYEEKLDGVLLCCSP
jgi:hypothetical protein